MKPGMSARFHASVCAVMTERMAVSSGAAAAAFRGDWARAERAAKIPTKTRKGTRFMDGLRRCGDTRSAYNEIMATAAETSPFRVVHTVCSHDCPDSCAVLVTVNEDGRAIKVQGDPAQPVTQGFLCGKVAKYLDRVYAPDRILYPLKRKTEIAKGPLARGRELESFERVSWDEALDGISVRFKETARQYGPESILPYSYAGTMGVLGYGSMDRRFLTQNAHGP